jgi:hypothetical protein
VRNVVVGEHELQSCRLAGACKNDMLSLCDLDLKAGSSGNGTQVLYSSESATVLHACVIQDLSFLGRKKCSFLGLEKETELRVPTCVLELRQDNHVPGCIKSWVLNFNNDHHISASNLVSGNGQLNQVSSRSHAVEGQLEIHVSKCDSLCPTGGLFPLFLFFSKLENKPLENTGLNEDFAWAPTLRV